MVEKTRHSLYMDIATRVSQESYAQRLKVGSVIVKNGRIISMGWNGMPSGWDNTCEDVLEDGTLVTKSETLHAESNALMKVAKSTESSDGATLYCTLAPCIDCAKLILQSGIKNVYYQADYRKDDGINFLKNSGVIIEKI